MHIFIFWKCQPSSGKQYEVSTLINGWKFKILVSVFEGCFGERKRCHKVAIFPEFRNNEKADLEIDKQKITYRSWVRWNRQRWTLETAVRQVEKKHQDVQQRI